MDGLARSQTQAAQKVEAVHVNALDGIRGLAILMVVCHHLISVNAEKMTPVYVWARAFKLSLWSGVDVFFALSGFLITGILLKTVSTPGFFRNFYARRSLRIFPLYYGVLLVIFACTPYFHIHWGGQQWRLLTYTNHIFLNAHDNGFNFYFGNGVNLANLWSLHVEEQFYLVWPLLVYLVRTPRRLMLVALALSAMSITVRFWMAFHGVSHDVLYATLITRADNIFVGACLALLVRTRFRSAALRAALPVFVVSMAALAAIFVSQHGLLFYKSDFFFCAQFTVLAIATTALIALCLDHRSVFARVFSTAFMRFFGKYSYGLYIFHSVLPMFVLPPLLRALAPIEGHPAVVHLITAVAELASAVLLSVLSYRFFEMPFLRLKKYFEYRSRPTIPEIV